MIRVDIRKYYASISRKQLLEQVCRHYQDPRLQYYFEQIIYHAVERDGEVFVPNRGIPRGSGMSPVFGALYLDALDKAMEARQGIAYFRFMDDALILTQTRRQYQRAKKRLFKILNTLELSLAPTKTRMGKLRDGFHFLGVQFEVSQNPQTKIQVSTQLHPRTYARARTKIRALQDNAGTPAEVQRYLRRWAAWWIGAGQCVNGSQLNWLVGCDRERHKTCLASSP